MRHYDLLTMDSDPCNQLVILLYCLTYTFIYLFIYLGVLMLALGVELPVLTI
jgi:hypothetical protein